MLPSLYTRQQAAPELNLGSVVRKLRFCCAELSHIPTLLFGTINGVIGVIASVPHQLYLFLETLQVSG